MIMAEYEDTSIKLAVLISQKLGAVRQAFRTILGSGEVQSGETPGRESSPRPRSSSNGQLLLPGIAEPHKWNFSAKQHKR